SSEIRAFCGGISAKENDSGEMRCKPRESQVEVHTLPQPTYYRYGSNQHAMKNSTKKEITFDGHYVACGSKVDTKKPLDRIDDNLLQCTEVFHQPASPPTYSDYSQSATSATPLIHQSNENMDLNKGGKNPGIVYCLDVYRKGKKGYEVSTGDLSYESAKSNNGTTTDHLSEE
ncbi:unnamed protein product, partial [Owenia fusiformis]